MNLNLFTIQEGASIKAALELIETNRHGVVLVINQKYQVIGLATDGDIRRALLQGRGLNDSIDFVYNRNFIWEKEGIPREQLLKKLDSMIRFIPILNEENKLVSIVTRDDIPHLEESRVYARSRSPVRISFGGGGSDLTHYFNSNQGAVINTTISLYSHAVIKLRDDYKIYLSSLDLKESIILNSFDDLLAYKGNFRLIQSVIKVARPDFGFELFIHSDFPMNSGLGGSAVVASSILGCFNQFRRDKWDQHEIAELAFQAERLHLGIMGGWQDQYATVFGGFNFMEFQKDQNIVHPLRIPPDTLIELEESLVLCDTGTTHDSGNIHDDQKDEMKKDQVKDLVKTNVQLTYEMRNHLLRGRLLLFGQCLHKAWELKRNLSSKISNLTLDQIYQGARENGAIGGKLLGAGGGGFFLFYVSPFEKHNLLNWIDTKGLRHQPFRFDMDGLSSWTVRENRNL